MAKAGRPGIPYETFVEVWEQLSDEGRAGTNAALAILGGSKATISSYRERYEREQASKEQSLIKSVELTEAVHRAIAGIKVKEVTALENENKQLKVRIDDYLESIKSLEETLAEAIVAQADAKVDFDVQALKLERQLAAAEARNKDLAEREQALITRCEQLSDAANQAKQLAAVAQKETEMLRERKR